VRLKATMPGADPGSRDLSLFHLKPDRPWFEAFAKPGSATFPMRLSSGPEMNMNSYGHLRHRLQNERVVFLYRHWGAR
jgi:hypothetical protein